MQYLFLPLAKEGNIRPGGLSCLSQFSVLEIAYNNLNITQSFVLFMLLSGDRVTRFGGLTFVLGSLCSPQEHAVLEQWLS